MDRHSQDRHVVPPANLTGWRVAFMGSTYSQFDPFGQSLLVPLPFEDKPQHREGRP